MGGITILQLASIQASPQPVGTTINWATYYRNTDPGTTDVRYLVRPSGGTFSVVRDYGQDNSFDWTPQQEGSYEIQTIVRNQATAETQQLTSAFVVTSLVTGSTAVISATPNPLVALYSAPACTSGSKMRVRFQKAGDLNWQATPFKNCLAGMSMNFYVAGMLANTQYNMKHDVMTGPYLISSAVQPFTTGTPQIGFPAVTVLNPAVAPNNVAYPVLLRTDLTLSQTFLRVPVATDLAGNVIWYYPGFYSPSQLGSVVTRVLAGGNMLLVMNQTNSSDNNHDTLREIDIAGNTLRETNVHRISEQLVALGHWPVGALHHEAIRLPDGKTALLASEERILTDTQGPGAVDVLGDVIVVLDSNFQVVWTWDSFDHLDVTRKAILDEKCASLGPGCPALTLASQANDWTHSNAIAYRPSDGNFLLGVRHQDWVLKIDYSNGNGTGNILWRLGLGGDFSLNSPDPYPWFSHCHDIGMQSNGDYTLFDNGNTRKAAFPSANSRGQVYTLDEVNMVATLKVNADLGLYSPALGTASRLANGNYHFLAGLVPDNSAQSLEVVPNGTVNFRFQSGNPAYRAFRLKDLYTP